MNTDYENLHDYAEEKTSSGTSKLLAGLLIGVGVGFVAGILLAPRSGKETRKQVVDSTGAIKNQLGDLMEKASKVASDYTEKGKELASKALHRN